MNVELTFPDDFVVASGLTEDDCLIELALRLYARRRITVEQGLRLSRLSRVEFEDRVAGRDVD